MTSKSAKILITGSPGCGKTTAVMKILEKLDCKNVAGFFTQEIRHNGKRLGFRWERLDGIAGTLAHVDIKGSFKVGRYGVDVAGFEKTIVPVLDAGQDAELFIIDEIGKMECFSEKFAAAVCRLFESDKSVIATVAKKGVGLISEVKNYPNVQLFNLSKNERDKTIAEILRALSFLQKSYK
jgi:nucleoside-triphosphatase